MAKPHLWHQNVSPSTRICHARLSDQEHTQTQQVQEYIEQLRPDTYDERRWADDIRVTMANGQPWNGLDLLNESHFPLHIDVPRTLPIAPVAMPP